MNKGYLLKTVKIILFFVITYAIIYLIGRYSPLLDFPFSNNDWIFRSDYMLITMPIVGFFFSILAIEWTNNFFEEKYGDSVFFPLFIWLFGIPSYYIAIYFYMGNIKYLGGNVEFNFLDLFINSQYIYFLISATFGWIFYKIDNFLFNRK
ncbi:MAG: hypothetical protein N3D73_01570 [Candidatus Diapherotrites archaeon]|nr:hypothetical protein [Candidatus Diapherotrites archaeon]